ncbi:hypothetical protein ACFFNY_13650 [Paenibacillus hodogayensis]|uniref:Uncharacterized protein n=1 Tax=Paenibacillus hodogayensis TaxID=279208 RepID=A0ABV5VWK5_9BACL
MWEELNRKLDEANARRQLKLKWERRLEDVQSRIRKLQQGMPALELKLEREQRDVEQLTGLTLTNLFHTILRSKEEQLELERQQELHAALRLQEAREQLADLERQRSESGEALADVRFADSEYEALLREKEKRLLACSEETAAAVAALDDSAAVCAARLTELKEAADAGGVALSLLRNAEESLGKAEDWGRWDMMGGGTISTHIKHSHIDSARSIVRQAQSKMRQFEKELADLGTYSSIRIDISGGLEFADYFLDGLITDWVVQGRIKDSLEQVRNARSRMSRIVDSLRQECATTESELTGLRGRRAAMIERA